ncbi:MAG: hypothetical protein AAF802_00535 [Planctomycetota bacterium]
MESPVLEVQDYERLEKLDRFLSKLLIGSSLRFEFGYQRDLWETLSLKYWLDECLAKEELAWYLEKFWTNLYNAREPTKYQVFLRFLSKLAP